MNRRITQGPSNVETHRSHDIAGDGKAGLVNHSYIEPEIYQRTHRSNVSGELHSGQRLYYMEKSSLEVYLNYIYQQNPSVKPTKNENFGTIGSQAVGMTNLEKLLRITREVGDYPVLGTQLQKE